MRRKQDVANRLFCLNIAMFLPRGLLFVGKFDRELSVEVLESEVCAERRQFVCACLIEGVFESFCTLLGLQIESKSVAVVFCM